METPIEDVEIVLTSGDYRLTVAPYGASLRGLELRLADGSYVDVATTYHGPAAKMGGQGDVLIPFPGRVGQGSYPFGGKVHQMVKNDAEGPSAIHGFVRTRIWDHQKAGNKVTFTTKLGPTDHEGYPFTLNVTMSYEVSAMGLTAHFTIENVGDCPAPVAAGFHPYFTVGSGLINGDILHAPYRKYLEYAPDLIPTGRVLETAGSPLDFRKPRLIGDVRINACFVDPIRDADGLLRVTLASADGSRKVTVWQDESVNYTVLYSGDPMPESHRRKSLAIEPQSCASDAFNHSGWGLVALEPGESFSGTWGVTAQ